MLNNSYETSPVKRKRATKAEMIERANFVADFTREFRTRNGATGFLRRNAK